MQMATYTWFIPTLRFQNYTTVQKTPRSQMDGRVMNLVPQISPHLRRCGLKAQTCTFLPEIQNLTESNTSLRHNQDSKLRPSLLLALQSEEMWRQHNSGMAPQCSQQQSTTVTYLNCKLSILTQAHQKLLLTSQMEILRFQCALLQMVILLWLQ